MFDNVAYDKFDMESKQKLWSILEQYGFKLAAPLTTEFYKETDIKTIDRDGKPMWFEIEVANKDTYFTFNNYVVNTRKSENKSHKYAIFSSDYKYLSIVEMSTVFKSPIREIRTKRGKENVYSVDKKLCKIFEIVNGNQLKRIR